MKKIFEKVVTMSLAAIMAVSAMSLGSFAEENDVVFDYIDENGNKAVITQAELDAEHWNVDALNGVAPCIYEEFPMSVNLKVDDIADMSLDLKYMKTISDMDSVHLRMKDMETDEIIYDENINHNKLVINEITPDKIYEIKLTECINNESTEYIRLAIINKETTSLSDYKEIAAAENIDYNILMSDINTLKQGISKDENGNTVIDSRIAKYERVAMNSFESYCETLSDDATYRIHISNDGVVYSGFMELLNGVPYIYNYGVKMCTWEEFYQPSTMSYPTELTTTELNSILLSSPEINFTDQTFRLKDTSTNSKFAAYYFYFPKEWAGTNGKSINISITGNAPVAMKIYKKASNVTNPSLYSSHTSSGSQNTCSKTIDGTKLSTSYDNKFYIFVYFQGNSDGYVWLNATTASGFGNDTTGSKAEAYNTMWDGYLNNTEFDMPNCWDVDAFSFGYAGDVSMLYKIAIKNRSLAEQQLLERGQYTEGSLDKYLTLWCVYDKGNILHFQETNTYTITEGGDVTIYCDPDYYGERVFTIHNGPEHELSGGNYQLSFQPMN